MFGDRHNKVSVTGLHNHSDHWATRMQKSPRIFYHIPPLTILNNGPISVFSIMCNPTMKLVYHLSHAMCQQPGFISVQTGLVSFVQIWLPPHQSSPVQNKYTLLHPYLEKSKRHLSSYPSTWNRLHFWNHVHNSGYQSAI